MDTLQSVLFRIEENRDRRVTVCQCGFCGSNSSSQHIFQYNASKQKASIEKVRIASTRSRAGMYLLVHLPRCSNKSASPEHIIFSRTYCEICDCLSYRLGNIRYAGKHGVQSSSRTVAIGRKLLLYEINQIITVSDKARTHIMAFS